MRFIKYIPFFCFFIATAILIWFTLKAYQTSNRISESNYWQNHSYEVIRDLQTTLLTISTLEAGVHEFIITGNPDFLQQNVTQTGDLYISLGSIKNLVQDNPTQQIRLDSLRNMLDTQLTTYRQFIQLKKESPPVTLDILPGKLGMDSIRNLTNRMLSAENTLLTERKEKHTNDTNVPFIKPITGIVIGMVFLFLSFLWLYKRSSKSEDTFRGMVDDVQVIIYTTDLAGFFTFVNKKMSELTGYSNSELVGNHCTLLLEDDTAEHLRNVYSEQQYFNKPTTTEIFQTKTKSGGKVWVEQIATLRFHNNTLIGFQCIVKDIDNEVKLKESNQHLEQKSKEIEHQLQSIIDNTPAFVFIKNKEGRYVLINNSFEEMFKISNEEIAGKTDDSLFSEGKAWDHHLEDTQVITQGMPVTIEESLEIDGAKCYYLITKFPLRNEAHEITGLCGIGTDITQQKDQEQILRNAKQTAEDAQRAQEVFLANMSHEIRTPMNGIIGLSNQLIKTPLLQVQAHYVNNILAAGKDLLVIINDILDFSKLRAENVTPENIPFDLPKVIEKMAFTFQIKLKEKGLKFYLDIDESIPSPLCGDPLRLNQILVNLVGNAVKFTTAGSVFVAVSLVSQHDDSARISFVVKDTGIGIPEAQQAKIFESFTQTRNDNARKYGGTGLGLAITKQLTTLLGGDITLESKAGAGTTFYVEIPFEKSLQPIDAYEAATEEIFPDDVLKEKKILVVEDNPVNQVVALSTLQSAGASVDVAATGLEAVGLALKTAYHCIIMDIQMPEMDGYKTTVVLRNMGIHTPIIAMTASAIKGEREKCLQAGMNDYTSKPFIPEELYCQILNSIGEQAPVTNRSTYTAPQPYHTTDLVDLTHLKEMMKYDVASINHALDEFLLFTPDTIDNLQSANENQDWEKVFFYAHRLSSSLTIIHVPLAKLLASELEVDAKARNKIATLPQRVQQVIALMNDAMNFIREKRNEYSDN
jgi:PAS domain S-box-containing protein